jgi:hypothetical protein
MALVDQVHIGKRFQRSVRIDTDLLTAQSLEGFICPESSADVLLTMARHISTTRQGAFTWTGPYGSGKSSLVVALGALLSGQEEIRSLASKVLGKKVSSAFWNTLPIGTKGWRLVPVVGRRESPIQVLGESLEKAKVVERKPRGGWTESLILQSLAEATTSGAKSSGGVILFIDEMGKFLESAAQNNSDVYVFQQLAEMASRSDGRLIVIGVLHQAFDEYAHKLSREVRDEWSKIQGRFVDLIVSTTSEEQVDLISRAIENSGRTKTSIHLSQEIAKHVSARQSSTPGALTETLRKCWPLHPVVACLLGPISRRRFGQNQRSIFGFLNSSEPHGFRDFLRRATDSELYRVDMLWDYLRANLEPSILASPDGHRWALAAEAIERCEGLGGDALHSRVLKTIAVIDLFKERSGIVPNAKILHACFPELSETALSETLRQLQDRSFIIFKKFVEAFAVFAGSDFDFDRAVRGELKNISEPDFAALRTLAGLQPIMAKRHYHDTGAIRWFDVAIAPLSGIRDLADRYSASNGAVGLFVLAVPTAGETPAQIEELCREVSRSSDEFDVIVGVSSRSDVVTTLAREFVALERVRSDRPELAGDPVARREVEGRLSVLQSQLESELRRAFDSAVWHRKNSKPKFFRQSELNSLASDLADKRFSATPRIHNELLNRQSPSANAIAAQNALLKRMVLNETESRLGIEGFPAEGGLYASLLEATGLHCKRKDAWRFVSPEQLKNDPANLVPMWTAANELLKANSSRVVKVSEIYDLWRSQPFGLKDGLMPVLAVAFMLSQRSKVAVYREGVFRSRFADVDVDYLARDAAAIEVRWVDVSGLTKRLLLEMGNIASTLGASSPLDAASPVDVARSLVAVVDQLPTWTRRTTRLSSNAMRVRDLFKQARDPNKFLFDDIPEVVGALGDGKAIADVSRIAKGLQEGLTELRNAYLLMLEDLKQLLFAEVQVFDASASSLQELRDRAENVRQLSGDFRLEAFIGRLAQFDASQGCIEGIASLLTNRPPRDWVDADVDNAKIELAEMAQKFLRAETLARIKGRSAKRHAMAVVVGMGNSPTPMIEEFEIADSDRKAVDKIVAVVGEALEGSSATRRTVILAALAELSATYMRTPPAGRVLDDIERRVEQ